MKRLLMLLAVVCTGTFCPAQSDKDADAVLKLLGCLSLEDADPDDVERLNDLLHDKINICRGDLNRLEASGLVSTYQLASLKDYMQRHGNVYSLAELSAVDGFGENYTDRIAPFISFSLPYGGLSACNVPAVKGEIQLRNTLRHTSGDDMRWNYGCRCRFDFKGNIHARISASKPYDSYSPYPSDYAFSLAWNHKSGKLILGDFNARFGQGLCLWNTTSFSSLTSPSTFMRRSSGLSQSNSFTGAYAYTGLASDLNAGKWKISAFLALPQIKETGLERMSIMPALNLTRRFRLGHVAATHYLHISDVFTMQYRIPQMKSSVDASLCVKGVNCFGEFAYDWVDSFATFSAGVETGAGENLVLAALVRYLSPKDGHGAALSGEFRKNRHELMFCSDVTYVSKKNESRIQSRIQLRWNWRLSEYFSTELRMSERLRTWDVKSRADMRTDVIFKKERFMASIRFNAVISENTGVLGYAEAAYVLDRRLKIYLRQGVFDIDSWDDRIFVYERDAPGNFNVPAFCGRGVWTSLYMTSRFTKWGNLSFRASYVSYPFMVQKNKPGKAELRIQLTLFV